MPFFLFCFLFLLFAESAWAQFDPSEIERAYQSKDYAKVETIAQARLLIDPYDVKARYYLASVLLQQKRGAQALVQYEACVKCGGSSPLAQMARKAIETLKIDAKKANPQYYVRKPLDKKGALAGPGSAGANGAKNNGSAASNQTGSQSGNQAGNPDAIPDSEIDTEPAVKEAVGQLRKDLADAIEVKRRRQSQDLELVAEEESQAIQEILGTLSLTRDEQIEAARADGVAKRAKVYRLYKEEEDSITRAYQLRIEALRNSHKKK